MVTFADGLSVGKQIVSKDIPSLLSTDSIKQLDSPMLRNVLKICSAK